MVHTQVYTLLRFCQGSVFSTTKNIERNIRKWYYSKGKAPTPKWMPTGKGFLSPHREPPPPLADRGGIFISAVFSRRESSATQLTVNQAISASRSLPAQP